MYLLFVFSQSQRLLDFVGNNSGTSAAGSQNLAAYSWLYGWKQNDEIWRPNCFPR